MVFKVKIKLKHLKNGKRIDPTHCALALALKDIGCQFTEGTSQGVAPDDIDFSYKGHYYLAEKTSQKLNNFINDFDNGHKLEPVELTLVAHKEY